MAADRGSVISRGPYDVGVALISATDDQRGSRTSILLVRDDRESAGIPRRWLDE